MKKQWRVKRRGTRPCCELPSFALLEQKLRDQAAEMAQRAQEFEALANNITGGLQVCHFDDVFTIRYVSDGFLKLTGYTRDDLLDNQHIQLVYPADVPLLLNQIRRQIETQGEFSVVYRIVRRDGELRWVLDNGNMLNRASDSAYVQCFLTDITAQKLQEEELLVSHKRYQIAQRQMDFSMFEYNIATRQLVLYEQDASLYGMPTIIEDGPNTLADSGYFDGDCIAGYHEMYRKVCSGEEPEASCLMTAHDVDGKPHEFQLSLTAVLDELGNPIRAIGVKRNTSHLRRLQREQEFVRTMVGGKTFICEADLTSDHVLFLNTDWCREIGIDHPASYTQLAVTAVQRLFTGGHRNDLLSKVSASHLISLLEQGQSVERFTFQQMDILTNTLVWYEATVNIIRDEGSGNVCVRIYHEDISERIRKETRATEERHIYESMVANAMVAYEVNITRDLALRGHENWGTLHDICPTSSYSQMIEQFAQHGMDPQDSKSFRSVFDRNRLLAAYGDGEREFSCQYRKRNSPATLMWVECTLHLYEDPDSSEIMGFSYVENIDRQKRAELELRYKAEHDALTDLYNKETTAELITQYLGSIHGRRGAHAFIMIDLDYFKEINDCFGHLFGDGVIAETAAYTSELFREDDIVGRIGGDEFCILMKHVGDLELVRERGEQLCNALTRSYSDGKQDHTISASIGIALFPVHGRSFEELYLHADSALYDAKRNGRNGYAIYG